MKEKKNSEPHSRTNMSFATILRRIENRMSSALNVPFKKRNV